MLGRATMKAIGQSLEKINKFFPSYHKSGSRVAREEEAREKEAALQSLSGRILAATEGGKTVIIDLGTNHGLKLGDALNVYREIHTQNSQGEIVYTELKYLGRIKVTEIQADRCKAVPESGTDFAETDVVRKH